VKRIINDSDVCVVFLGEGLGKEGVGGWGDGLMLAGWWGGMREGCGGGGEGRGGVCVGLLRCS